MLLSTTLSNILYIFLQIKRDARNHTGPGLIKVHNPNIFERKDVTPSSNNRGIANNEHIDKEITRGITSRLMSFLKLSAMFFFR